MKAVIVGAGRGWRMGANSADKPKCLLELGGRTLLDWTISSLREAGINDLAFVGGYQIDQVRRAFSSLRYYFNSAWSETNVLVSLFTAEPDMHDALLVSYSDVVHLPAMIGDLIRAEGDITLLVDTSWVQRHSKTSATASNAEKVRLDREGRVIAIGKHLLDEQAQAEFMGLMKLSRRGAEQMRRHYHTLLESHNGHRFHQASRLTNAYLTDFLQDMIDQDIRVDTLPVAGNWLHFDTIDDLHNAHRLWANKGVELFWATRSAGYQQLDWASRRGYLEQMVDCGQFQKHHTVLDVGTGTGRVALEMAPRVGKVIGVDISPDMLKQARQSLTAPNVEFRLGDVAQLNFDDDSFDRVTARMVFHHLIDTSAKAARECYRVLRPGGLFVLSEGVPPHRALADWYTRVFALKEERLTFFEDDLARLLEQAGFEEINCQIHITPQVSIRNWLENSGLPTTTQDVIYQMHLDLEDDGKSYYNMRVLPDDILIDLKFAILTGRKPVRGSIRHNGAAGSPASAG
jgi:choline kinase/ubiquinone/menaquinone biosynthesis C-methylase UbiE